MSGVITTFILAILLLGGIVLLQAFLSKRESKWPGLVLPIISFLISFIYPLNMVVFTQLVTMQAVLTEIVLPLILLWLLGNIPTFILLAIYFGCRGKERRNKQLEKMNIQDLD